jgi:Rrf2 family iron-sulfur cluster assembly transcriptional regulator
MLLLQTAEYAMRAISALAAAGQGVSLTAPDLADQTGIPPAYLSKVMRRLVVARLVLARKGHGGGFRLARRPDQVRFADVLRACDEAVGADRCAFGWGQCDPAHPCPLHPAWSQLNAALHAWADRTTLADVVPHFAGFSARTRRPAAARRRAAGAGSRAARPRSRRTPPG